jgi:hypothetical protein
MVIAYIQRFGVSTIQCMKFAPLERRYLPVLLHAIQVPWRQSHHPQPIHGRSGEVILQLRPGLSFAELNADAKVGYFPEKASMAR